MRGVVLFHYSTPLVQQLKKTPGILSAVDCELGRKVLLLKELGFTRDQLGECALSLWGTLKSIVYNVCLLWLKCIRIVDLIQTCRKRVVVFTASLYGHGKVLHMYVLYVCMGIYGYYSTTFMTSPLDVKHIHALVRTHTWVLYIMCVHPHMCASYVPIALVHIHVHTHTHIDVLYW